MSGHYFSVCSANVVNGGAANHFLFHPVAITVIYVKTGYRSQTWNTSTLQSYAENPSWPSTPSTWRKKYYYGEEEPAERGKIVKIEVNNDSDGNADVIETFVVDQRGQTVAKTTEMVGLSDPKTFSYKYDNAGNITDIIYPDQSPLIMTEIHINSESHEYDNGGEFIEIKNIADHPVDLEGWTLRDIGGDYNQYYTVEQSHILEAGETAIFANNHSSDYDANYGYGYDFDLSSEWHVLQLQNWSSDDVISLEDPSGRIVDVVSWNNRNWEGVQWGLTVSSNENYSFHRTQATISPTVQVSPDEWVRETIAPYSTEQLEKVTRVGDVIYTYNWLGQVENVGTREDPSFYGRFTYNADGSIANEKLHNQEVERSYSYNSPGWLTQINGDYFSQNLKYAEEGYYSGLIGTSDYTYSWSNPGSGYPSAPSNIFYRYTYDERSQLVTAASLFDSQYSMGSGTNKELQFDPNGNITRYNIGTDTRNYNYNTGTNQFNNDGSDQYTYDASGRVTQIFHDISGQVQNFSYDPYLGKATQISGYQTANYTYGADNERAMMEVGTGSSPDRTIYLRGLNDYPLVEMTNSGSSPYTSKKYIYGPTGLLAIHQGQEDYVYFPLKDNLGSTRVLLETKPAGSSREVNPAAVYDYLPFGEEMRMYGGMETSYLYTGQEYEEATDLYNYRARHYAQRRGHFLAPDPQGQFHSPYMYAGNNPVNFVDPDGEFAIPLLVGAAIGGIAGGMHAANNPNMSIGRGILYGSAIGALSGGAAAGVSSIGAGAMISGAAAGAVGGAGFAGMGSEWNSRAMMTGGLIGAAGGLIGGGVAAGIGGAQGAFAGGVASNISGQLLTSGDINLLQAGASGLFSVGTYHANSYAHWKYGGGKSIDGQQISYRQFNKINTAFQKSRFRNKEYGVYLNADGSGRIIQGEKFHVNFNDFRRGDYGIVHTHWAKEGSIWVDIGGTGEITRFNSSVNYPEGSFSFEAVGNHHSPADLNIPTFSIVVGRTGSSYFRPWFNNSQLITRDPFIRYFLLPWNN